MNKINTLSTPNQSFDYTPRQNAPQGSVGIMYEKKVKNPDGTVTTKLKNFYLNSAGFHTKALASGYSPLKKATAKAYIESKGISPEGTKQILEKITANKHIDAGTFESTIKSQQNLEMQSDLTKLEKLAKDIS
jgi:phenylalanyl-tRNA synthetase beta subunit